MWWGHLPSISFSKKVQIRGDPAGYHPAAKPGCHHRNQYNPPPQHQDDQDQDQGEGQGEKRCEVSRRMSPNPPRACHDDSDDDDDNDDEDDNDVGDDDDGDDEDDDDVGDDDDNSSQSMPL